MTRKTQTEAFEWFVFRETVALRDTEDGWVWVFLFERLVLKELFRYTVSFLETLSLGIVTCYFDL